MFLRSKTSLSSLALLIGIVSIWTLQFDQCSCQSDSVVGVCSSEDDFEEPLLLTPLLEEGKIQEAQEASRVYIQDYPNIISYSGFFTVDKQFNSNLFFWFFLAANGNKSAPVLLWLQGGPGGTSFYGLFVENGPFQIEPDLSFTMRKYSWTTTYSVLYIDNPVGTGYSFTDPGGYSTNETQIGEHLYLAITQFFTLFSELQANEFFITGESYAGKYVPAACYMIHQRNPTASMKINLKGFAIGNAWIDPETQARFGDYFYQIGILDAAGRDLFKQKESEINQYILDKQWTDALKVYDVLISGYFAESTIFQNLTGFDVYYNFLYTKDYTTEEVVNMEKYLSDGTVRKTLHAGSSNSTFNLINRNVGKYLLEDIMQSVKPWFEVLVENYRVLLYNGHLDLVVPFPGTEAFLDSLCWSGAEAYKTAPRCQWYVGEELAGYSKTVKNLKHVLVRNSGHLVPADQPAWALDMISKFIGNSTF